VTASTSWVPIYCLGASDPTNLGVEIAFDIDSTPDQFGIQYYHLQALAAENAYNIPIPQSSRVQCGTCTDPDCYASASIAFDGLDASTPCNVTPNAQTELDMTYKSSGILDVSYFCQPENLTSILLSFSPSGGLAFKLVAIDIPWFTNTSYEDAYSEEGLVGTFVWPGVISRFGNSVLDAVEVGRFYDLPEVYLTHGAGAFFGSAHTLDFLAAPRCSPWTYPTWQDGSFLFYMLPALSTTYNYSDLYLDGMHVVAQSSDCFDGGINDGGAPTTYVGSVYRQKMDGSDYFYSQCESK
jgi:hypothetical protein